ncbi:MFS transporter [Novosphingobium pentaromativorans]|nr:MFS transporter [Novosphingobium pentaromativorans]
MSEKNPKNAETSPFKVPFFRTLWVTMLISAFGTNIQGVGAAWLMTELSGSASMVALVQTSMVLPLMLFSLLAGALADGFERRTVMIAAQLSMLVASLGLIACAVLDLLTPSILLAFTFIIGSGMAFNAPASQAAIGEIVPRPALPGAVAYMSMTFNIGRSLGPALGGIIVGALGAVGAFAFNAFTYLPLTAVLLRWKPPETDTSLPRERIFHAMAAGIHYTRMSPDILRVIPRAALFGFGVAAVSGLMPVIAREELGGGPLTYGLLLGAYGIGSVAAGFVVRPLLERLGSEKVVLLASLCAMAGTTTIAFSPYIALSMLALTFVGIGWVLALSSCNTVVQLAAPRWVVARTLSIYQMGAFGAMAIGAATFGTLADHIGVPYALLAAAGVHLASILIGRVLPIVDVERDLDPHDWNEPDLALPIEGRSGPIVISIAYEIDRDDVPRFLALMTERRRVRRRDGAHGWTLMRDLNAPDRWVERYDVATWHDYIRHNKRHTVADTENWSEILALHRGDGRPRVTRLIERQTANLPGARLPSAREMSGIAQP